MFEFLKKKRDGVVDLSSMEKSGLIARSKEMARIKKLEGMKQGEVLDLTNANLQTASSASESPFSFLGDIASAESQSTQTISPSFDSISSLEDGKSKIAKRLLGMTDKMEQQDKEIYSLQQRLELLERKLERLEGR